MGGRVPFSLLGWCVAATLAIAACAPPAAAPSPASQPAGPAAASQPAAPAAATEWDKLVKAAQAEGSVAVATSPATDPSWRTAVTDTFSARYNVRFEAVPLAAGALNTRLQREQTAGQLTIDASVGGTSAYFMLDDNLIEPMPPLLLEPGVTDPKAWRNERLKVMGPEPGYFLQVSEWVMTDLVVNKDLVDPRQIQTWQDLLKPEFRGKIAAFDPRPAGAGEATGIFLYTTFGRDFVERLYVGQQPQLTTESRQLMEWVARGAYPIGLSLLPSTIEPMRAEGFPLERVFPSDDPGHLTGGAGFIMALKGSQHPNAARLFVNWHASKEGQEVWARTVREPSLRADVDLSALPGYIIPRPGVTYAADDANYEFFVRSRAEGKPVILDILGR
jgi:iron(III) transport system substrate-binding protein